MGEICCGIKGELNTATLHRLLCSTIFFFSIAYLYHLHKIRLWTLNKTSHHTHSFCTTTIPRYPASTASPHNGRPLLPLYNMPYRATHLHLPPLHHANLFPRVFEATQSPLNVQRHPRPYSLPPHFRSRNPMGSGPRLQLHPRDRDADPA